MASRSDTDSEEFIPGSAGLRAFRPWTLREAIIHCAEPDDWSSYAAAYRKLKSAGGRTRILGRWNNGVEGGAGYDDDSLRRRRKLAAELDRAKLRLASQYRKHLRSGKLVATGRIGDPTAPETIIPGDAWEVILKINWRKSNAINPTTPPKKIFSIRIYPAIEAPNAIDELVGLTFVEACERFVFQDPQLLSRRKRAKTAGGSVGEFGYCWMPYSAIWPVNFGSECPYNSPVGYLNRDRVHMKERAVIQILQWRFGRLISYLDSGQLVAKGFCQPQNALIDLPRALWRRTGSYIDLENGDLIECRRHVEDETKALSPPTFTGLMLEKPVRMPSNPTIPPDLPNVPNKKSVRNVQTSASAYSECRAWLGAEMQASPHHRTRTKNWYWSTAQTKWPEKLSKRRFDIAWSEAIRIAKAPAWAAAGAPKKVAS